MSPTWWIQQMPYFASGESIAITNIRGDEIIAYIPWSRDDHGKGIDRAYLFRAAPDMLAALNLVITAHGLSIHHGVKVAVLEAIAKAEGKDTI